MTFTIVGLNGEPGAGKDTVADYLVAQHGFTKLAFADALKCELTVAFRLTDDMFNDRVKKVTHTPLLAIMRCRDQGFINYCMETLDFSIQQLILFRTPRWVMQTWGDYKRMSNPDYFINKLAVQIGASANERIVISDVRMENEARFVLRSNGQVWNINRVFNPHMSVTDGHISNSPLPHWMVERSIWNGTTVGNLLRLVDISASALPLRTSDAAS